MDGDILMLRESYDENNEENNDDKNEITDKLQNGMLNRRQK